MRREFDVFEKFPDGATIWRASVYGRFEAQRKLDELAERSKNHFYMIEIDDHLLSRRVAESTKRKSAARSAAAGSS